MPEKYDAKKLAEKKARIVEPIGQFKSLMQDRRNAPLARQVLRKLFPEPLKCTPVVREHGRKDCEIAGRGVLSALPGREQVASPRGTVLDAVELPWVWKVAA